MDLAKVIKQRDELIGRTLKTNARKTEFKVVEVSERGISVRPQNSKSDRDRPIRALEVQLMGNHWEAFKAGSVTRTELANGNPKIFNTSYLESIFSALETPV